VRLESLSVSTNLRQKTLLIVRLGRHHFASLQIAALEARGVGFRSLTEAIDTTTPGGRLIFHVFGALGQFERDLIRERTKAGLTAAAARGRKGGRKPVVTADKLQRAQDHIANGLNVREAATRLKVSKTALYAALQSASAADS
jgi:DNA invertase Pin-like site-specific DNA recombinase